MSSCPALNEALKAKAETGSEIILAFLAASVCRVERRARGRPWEFCQFDARTRHTGCLQ